MLLLSTVVLSSIIRAENTVSVHQLGHRLPADARPHLARSLAALHRGETAVAITHLESVVARDPDNAEARNDLGVLYLKQGVSDKAVEQLKQAARLRESSADAHRALSAAQLETGDTRSAEAAARRSLSLEPDSLRSRYLLGLALTARREHTAETAQHLRAASTRFPECRLRLTVVLLHLGQLVEARAELDRYLEDPRAEQREVAVRWKKLLTIE